MDTDKMGCTSCHGACAECQPQGCVVCVDGYHAEPDSQTCYYDRNNCVKYESSGNRCTEC